MLFERRAESVGPRPMIVKMVLVSALVLGIVLPFGASCRRGGESPEAGGVGEKAEPAVEERVVRITGAFPLYPDPGVGLDFVECAALGNLYDTLVFPTLDGQIEPHLATDWQVSSDGLKYTFNLRRGVKFHDGSELEAEDIVFSMHRLITMGEGFGYLFEDVVESARATDKYTVEFKLKKPFGPFVSALVRLYVLNKDLVMQHLERPGQYGEFGDYGKKWLLTNDAGSGPYRILEVKLEEYLLAERFEDYWEGWEESAPEYVKFLGSCEPVTVRTLMARRELEITDEWQPAENVRAMDGIEGVDVAYLPNGSICNIMLNTKKPPTDDVHFRKALAYCLDYDVTVDKIYPGSKRSNGPVASMYPGHNPNLVPYERNLDIARVELKKSKYYQHLDKYPVTMSWCAEVPDEEKIALLLQANAAELGIKVEVLKTPYVTICANVQNPETTAHGTILFQGDSYPDAGSVLKTRYHSSTCGTTSQCEWLQDPEIDRLIEKALATPDQAARFKTYHEIQEKLVNLCPTIWLFEQAEMRAYQAAYLSWPAADYAKDGRLLCPTVGRMLYAREMKVFPERRVGPAGE
ncbi:MAG TPA: ABC transporter substrate-binding protein [Firmicutes bacterium]|nr:ABC transporter substrate-binding protein [Bacillota bacterium]